MVREKSTLNCHKRVLTEGDRLGYDGLGSYTLGFDNQEVREGVVRGLVPFYTDVGASETRIPSEWKVKQNRKQKKS